MQSEKNEIHLIGRVAEPFERIGGLGFKFYLEIIKNNKIMARIPIFMPKNIFEKAPGIRPGKIALIDGLVERSTNGSCVKAKFAKLVSEKDSHCSFGTLDGFVQYNTHVLNNENRHNLTVRNVLQNFANPEKPVCSLVYANEKNYEAFKTLRDVSPNDKIEVHGIIGHNPDVTRFITIRADRVTRR